MSVDRPSQPGCPMSARGPQADMVKPLEEDWSAARLTTKLTFKHRCPTANDGAHRPTGHLSSVISRPANLGRNPVIGDRAPGLKIDERKVGIGPLFPEHLARLGATLRLDFGGALFHKTAHRLD